MPITQDKSAVSEWRFDICVQLGFAVDHAVVLAERHDIDLHEIIKLAAEPPKGKGCPPAQAFLILL